MANKKKIGKNKKPKKLTDNGQKVDLGEVFTTKKPQLITTSEKIQELKAPEELKKLEAPPIIMSGSSDSDNLGTDTQMWKVVATIAITLLAIGTGYYILFSQQTESEELTIGAEVNAATFADILSKSNHLYVIMDIRNASSDIVRKNIMQCGVDLTSSFILATGKSVTPYTFEGNNCEGMEGNTSATVTISQCIKNVKNKTIIYVYYGNQTKFYTNMMRVGIGSNYTYGECKIQRTS